MRKGLWFLDNYDEAIKVCCFPISIALPIHFFYPWLIFFKNSSAIVEYSISLQYCYKFIASTVFKNCESLLLFSSTYSQRFLFFFNFTKCLFFFFFFTLVLSYIFSSRFYMCYFISFSFILFFPFYSPKIKKKDSHFAHQAELVSFLCLRVKREKLISYIINNCFLNKSFEQHIIKICFYSIIVWRNFFLQHMNVISNRVTEMHNHFMVYDKIESWVVL